MAAKKIILLAVIVVLLVIGGVFYHAELSSAPTAPPGSAPTSTAPGNPTPTSTTPTSTSPSATGLSPTSGPVGTTVTITGSGFDDTSVVEMGGLVAASDAGSADGKTIVFSVPQSLAPYCKPSQPCPQFLLVVTPKAYVVSVLTNDVTQTIGTFTVTSGGRSN